MEGPHITDSGFNIFLSNHHSSSPWPKLNHRQTHNQTKTKTGVRKFQLELQEKVGIVAHQHSTGHIAKV